VGNILLDFFLSFLIKSKTCIIGGASPFAKMRDTPRQRASLFYSHPHNLEVY
jgi:hypothetical protein